MDKFDPKLNMNHLQQCMAKLLRSDPQPAPIHPPRAPPPPPPPHTQDDIHPEYEAYYLLMNLGQCHVTASENDDRITDNL